jgi:UDP-glucose 4-epimerase
VAVLVTGAAGFLGSRLVERLAALGHDVVAMARTPRPERWASTGRVAWIERDIARDGLAPDEIAGIDTVFHLAGATLGAGTDEWRFLCANEATTVRLLQTCAGRVKRVIFASSQVVYGDANHLAVTEAFPLEGVKSAYACSKVNSEQWLKWFQGRHGGLYLTLRLSGFVEGGGIIDYIIDRAMRNQPIELLSKGAVRRDYLPVAKGIDAFLAAFRYEGAAGFTPFNIGSGQIISAYELATLICTEMASSSEIVQSPRPAPQGDFVFDTGHAARCLKFEPGDLRDGIRQYVRLKQVAAKEGCA